ncbi:MAG: hypothetical protein JKX70_11535 [Phycisphaerales bacterium]|nr:hypothetical protein [Phycisphaerales bacterium]
MPQTSNIQTQQIPRKLRLSAAERLVAVSGRREAAKRLLASAPKHGIDLDLMWGVIEHPSAELSKKTSLRVRQVALAVLGSGRTAMIFLSNPDNTSELGSEEIQTQEISASVIAALEGLRALAPERVTLAQTLIEPEHTWAHKACSDAGMICVGQLDYLRKPIAQDGSATLSPPPLLKNRCGLQVSLSERSDRLIPMLEILTMTCPLQHSKGATRQPSTAPSSADCVRWMM